MPTVAPASPALAPALAPVPAPAPAGARLTSPVTMTQSAELLEIASRRLYPNYRPAPVVFARGEGCALFDVEGRRWLDLAAGVAVCSVGHAHPRLVKAIAEQAARLMHVSNYFYNEENIRLADELCDKSGMARAFFCNSGAEANEAMFKLARRHFYAKGETKRTRIVAFHNAFHGRTMGALSLTGTPKYREGFGEIEGVVHVAYGDLEAVRGKMGRDVAAILVEPVQGEGGVLPPPAGFLKGLRALADEHGALLLMDEVQTGMGRLGHWFGFQGAGVSPDALSLAKGMGGGFPIGAMLTTEALATALPPGTHGSTFGGNPLASVAARTVLRILEEENVVAAVKAKGERLSAMLRELVAELPVVCEGERGEGLLRGLVLKQGFVVRDILPKLAEEGVLLTAAGERVLRFSPPLVVSEAELAEGVGAVRKVLSSLGA
jgi:acetylornithine/N-succinyldiaminopimelate aminotransferase